MTRWPNPHRLEAECEAAGVPPGTVRERVDDYVRGVHELAVEEIIRARVERELAHLDDRPRVTA